MKRGGPEDRSRVDAVVEEHNQCGPPVMANRQQKPLPDRSFFWTRHRGGRTRAMRKGPWKMVVSFRGRGPKTRANADVELFNLDGDLGEKTNVATQHPERAAAMHEELNAWYTNAQKTATPQQSRVRTRFSSGRRLGMAVGRRPGPWFWRRPTRRLDLFRAAISGRATAVVDGRGSFQS